MSKLSDRIIQVLIRKMFQFMHSYSALCRCLGRSRWQWGEFIRLPREWR